MQPPSYVSITLVSVRHTLGRRQEFLSRGPKIEGDLGGREMPTTLTKSLKICTITTSFTGRCWGSGPQDPPHVAASALTCSLLLHF